MTYSPEDWLEDHRWYSALTVRLQTAGTAKSGQDAPFRDYFAQKYQDSPSVIYHRERMAAALNYFERHIREFDISSVAVVGDTTALTTKALSLALWRMYADCPDAKLSTDFPTAIVVQFAKENQKLLDADQ